MIKPEKPIPGKRIPSTWFPAFYDFVMSLVPKGDLRTTIVRHTPNGTVISTLRQEAPAAGGGGADGTIYWAYIKLQSEDPNNYTADIYSNRDVQPSQFPADPIYANQNVYVHDLEDIIPQFRWIPVAKEQHGTGESITTKWTCKQQLGAM
jgi:hypothetical protein